MFGQQWPSRKRLREEDEMLDVLGFSEHRRKRRIATIPHRTSPKVHRYATPTFNINHNPRLAPPTVTPADSDSDDVAGASAPSTSSLAPWPSSPTQTLLHNNQSVHSVGCTSMPSPQVTQFSKTAFSAGDMEMSDSVPVLVSPGPFHDESSRRISSRVPTPIHSSFSPLIRSEKMILHQDPDFADDEGMADRFRRGRRLPSPISECETSPSAIVEGLGDMQMEIELPSQDLIRLSPSRKGHTRSKHSLRNWGGELGGHGTRKSFSMGYRNDCEKCRMKVPGHFSHIVTY